MSRRSRRLADDTGRGYELACLRVLEESVIQKGVTEKRDDDRNLSVVVCHFNLVLWYNFAAYFHPSAHYQRSVTNRPRSAV